MKEKNTPQPRGPLDDPRFLKFITPLVFLFIIYWARIKPALDEGKTWKDLVKSMSFEWGWLGVVISGLMTILSLALGFALVILTLKVWHFFRPVKTRTIRVRLQDEMDVKPKQVLELAGSLGTLWE